MDKYTKIIYWSDADNKFIVEVPELAGCMADGNTPEEALFNSGVIISEWIETAELLGREIPDPSSYKGSEKAEKGEQKYELLHVSGSISA